MSNKPNSDHDTNTAHQQHSHSCCDDDNCSSQTYVRETSKVGRNDPCVCDSGKKYKKCCGK